MEDPSLLRLSVALGPLAVLLGAALLFPRSRLARRLLAPVGPRFDLRAMTRRQCLRSAAGFGLFGATGIGLFALIAIANSRLFGGFDSNLPLAVVAGTYLLLGLLCLVPGVVLLLLAPLRPAVFEESAAVPLPPLLKEYRSPDRRVAIRLYMMSDGQVLVLQSVFDGAPPANPDDMTMARQWSKLTFVALATTLEDAEATALRIITPESTVGDGV